MNDQRRHDDAQGAANQASFPYSGDDRLGVDMDMDLWNAEVIHENALAAAQLQHQKIRESALRAIELHRLELERDVLRRQAEEEETRLRIAQEKAREEEKIRLAQERARIAEAEAREKARILEEAEAREKARVAEEAEAREKARIAEEEAKKAAARQASQIKNSAPSVSQNTVVSVPENNPSSNLGVQVNGQPTQPPVSQSKPAASASAKVATPFPIDEYARIHQSLKELRRGIADMGTQNNDFKKKVGEMRREIRKSVGQLREGKGANAKPNQKIFDMLDQALALPTPPVDPRSYMLARPQPKDGAAHNGETLPSLFIYLLNIYAKAIVSQFVEEAGVSPKAAEPIGLNASMVFSRLNYCWRGQSLIDILMAKIRVSCPVLFGVRGNEKTEEGRARLGWKKDDDGSWTPEQIHNTRMTGIGAGYASIALRDYSKSACTNPYPPSKYWMSMSLIVSTPPEEASSTQYTVLKAMIENYEDKFLKFYGTAGRAALRVALVDWPNKAVKVTAAVGGLQVLADKLRRDYGMDLTKIG